MNRYDIWKTQEPEYLAGNPPCECGHEYDDHEPVRDEVYEADTGRWSIEAEYMNCVRGCNCHEYREAEQ